MRFNSQVGINYNPSSLVSPPFGRGFETSLFELSGIWQRDQLALISFLDKMSSLIYFNM